jgi:hypothetical protein
MNLPWPFSKYNPSVCIENVSKSHKTTHTLHPVSQQIFEAVTSRLWSKFPDHCTPVFGSCYVRWVSTADSLKESCWAAWRPETANHCWTSRIREVHRILFACLYIGPTLQHDLSSSQICIISWSGRYCSLAGQTCVSARGGRSLQVGLLEIEVLKKTFGFITKTFCSTLHVQMIKNIPARIQSI